MKMTIGKKLGIGFFTILVLMFAIGGVSIWKMTEMGNQATEIKETWMPAVKLLGEIKADVINVERLSLRLVLQEDAGGKEQIEASINAALEDLKKKQDTYKTLIVSEQERQLFEQLVSAETDLMTVTPKLIEARKANDNQTALKLASEMRLSLDQVLVVLDQSIDSNGKASEVATDTSIQLYESGKLFVDVVSIAALLFGIVITFVINRMIATPIGAMNKAAKKIAKGDLTAEDIRVKNRDEIGDLAASFNDMTASLRRLILQAGESAQMVAHSAEQLTASSEQISSATAEIASTLENVAEGSDRQASSIADSAKTIDELSAGIQYIAANAQNVTSAAIQASDMAKNGNETIRTTVEQMNAINRTVSGLAQAVKGLGMRSEEIGQIVSVISGIASQTNLLALNAAIEAARVGEHGTGFAVVAAEVRKLAEQSVLSAEQIAALITSIQDETAQAVHLMETGTHEVSEGIKVVHLAGEAFDHIQRSVSEVAMQIQEVSAASRQMTASTEQVVRSIHVISKTAETASAGMQHVSTVVEEQQMSMEEITASASSLSRMSEKLHALIGKFKV